MSKYLTLFVVMLVGAFVLNITTSCEKALDTLTPEFSCNMDGMDWSTHSVIGSSNDSTITYIAMEDSIMVSLWIANLTEGDHIIDNENNYATCTKDDAENIYFAKEGVININKISLLKVDLTFNFKAFNILGDSIQVIDGVGKNLVYL